LESTLLLPHRLSAVPVVTKKPSRASLGRTAELGRPSMSISPTEILLGCGNDLNCCRGRE